MSIVLIALQVYEHWLREVESPRHTVVYKLQPGTVLFLDNWRILHARTHIHAPAGSRLLCGAYCARDEWVAKARSFHLLPF